MISFNDVFNEIHLFIFIFFPATRVNICSQPVRETCNQFGMALLVFLITGGLLGLVTAQCEGKYKPEVNLWLYARCTRIFNKCEYAFIKCIPISLSVEVADQSWPSFIYAPHNASVYINCTTNSSNPFWSINLAGDNVDSFLPFFPRGEDLNNEGLYDIGVAGGTVPPTLRLLINDTEVNNQTMIECVGRAVTHRTVIFLYGKYTVSLFCDIITPSIIIGVPESSN